jgi:hypothetical protein
MTMKTMKVSVIVVVIMLILSSCGRDLSTPSSRLVGHWRAETTRKIEYYISKSTITEYDPGDGSVFTGKYTIFSETPDGEKVTLDVIWPGGNGDDLIDFMVGKDGNSTIMMSFRINYIDNRNTP